MIAQDTSLDTSPKLCLRQRHRKWHRSPHNRFKRFKLFIPESKISIIILLTNAILVRLVVVVVCVPPANNSNDQSSSQHQQQLQLNQQASISITKTNHSAANPIKPLTSLSPSEQQVYLPASNQNHNSTLPIAAANGAKPARQARIYRIRAAVDGKLSLPVRVAGDRSAANRMAKQLSGDQRPQVNNMSATSARAPDEFGARTTPPTTVMMTSSSSIDARKSINGSRVDAAVSSPQKPINQTTPQQRPCSDQITGSSGGSLTGTSIAATSPTLHLIVNNNKRLSSMNRPLVNSQRTNVSAVAQVSPLPSGDDYLESTVNLSPGEAPSKVDGSAVSAIEVDESSEPLSMVTHNRQTPVVPSQVAPPTAPERTGSLDDYDSKMVTNRTKAHLSCDSGEMVLRLNFTEPYRGIVYPDHNRLSPCRFFGDGHNNYELRLPLRGCGTRQATARVFVNDVIVRFHKTLELEEDEVKTLICRYPPPVAQAQATPALTMDGASGGSHLLQPGLQQVAANSGGIGDGVFGASSPDNSYNNNRPALVAQTEVDARIKSPYSIGASSSPASPSSPSQAANPNFELIDPSSGQYSRNGHRQQPPSNSNNNNAIETMSESLLVAPASGHKSNHLVESFGNDTDNSYDIFPRQQQPGNQLFGYGTSLSRFREPLQSQSNPQRNNAIILLDDNNQQSPVTRGSSGAMQFLDRLSSIELLFLISSLMFIVLMALGLAGSYYCLRRRRRTHREQTASSMLRAVHRRAASGRPTQQILTPRQYAYTPSSSITHHNQHSHHQPHHHLSSGNASGQSQLKAHYTMPATTMAALSAPLSSASSPDSDLSGRGHLLNSSAGGGGGGYYVRNQLLDCGRHTLASGKRQAPVGGRRAKGDCNDLDQQQVVVGRAATLNRQQRHLPASHSNKRARQQPASGQWYMVPPPNQPPARLYRVSEAAPAASLRRSSTMQHDLNHQCYDNEAFVGKTRSFVSPAAAGEVSSDENETNNNNNNNNIDIDDQSTLVGDNNNELLPPTSQQTTTNYRSSLQHRNEDLLKHQRQQLRRHYLSQQQHDRDKQQQQQQQQQQQHRQHLSDDDDKDNDDPNRKSRLVLKRIDDSYVTNITEIVEKEYMQRDSMRPLGWAEWRRAAHEAAATGDSRNRSRRAKRQHEGQVTSDSDDSDNNYRSNTLASAAGGGMRSLTEVDVDFTRSLMRNAPVGGGTGQRNVDGTEMVADSETGKDRGRDQDDNDLMISPEYDCDSGLRKQQRPPPQVSRTTIGVKHIDNSKRENNNNNSKRLELVVSPTSQDSVSYV